ncbi:MAG TPA: LysM domain-containing protein [Polyangiales bacterium]|nr:LysM domain-containing protein [Polyangiales bacterium]
MKMRDAAFALRTALPLDALGALFECVFERSPFAQPAPMLDALEEALGCGFPGECDPPTWAAIVVAQPTRPTPGRRGTRPVLEPRYDSTSRAWIGLETVRENGAPAALMRCAIETASGDVHSLVTDAEGHVRIEGIPAGVCKVRLPHLAEDAWRAPVAKEPAHQRRDATHVVKQGESVARIARQHGIGDWRQVWEHGANAALRARRSSPHVLLPGDRLHIPPTPVHQVKLSTDQLHRIVIEEPQLEISVRLQDRAKRPLADLTYKVLARNIDRPGAAPTDADGVLREHVPIGTDKLVVQFDRPRLRFELLIDQLDPAVDGDQPVASGADARLHALGFSHGSLRDRTTAFQRTRLNQQDPDGLLDEATCRELEREYGA